VTIPQFDDTPTENLGGGEKRDPSEFIPWDRIAEAVTPRGTRPGLVIIVRPLERVKESSIRRGTPVDPDEDWKTLVVADIAILDAIPSTPDQYGMMLPPVAPGSQWRNQLVFPGLLNKAWRDKIGGTLIGVVYYGQAKPTAQGTMGKPPFLWRSLSQDEQQVRRGQGFMAARPEFLIPIPRVQQAPAQDTYKTAEADPWSQPLQQPQQGYAAAYTQAPPAPVQYQPQPVQTAPVQQTAPPQGSYYQQPDPWAQQPAQPVAPAQQAPQQSVQQPMSTLDQLKRQAAQAVNAQGQPQNGEPPF
jgi:hypothetical protein